MIFRLAIYLVGEPKPKSESASTKQQDQCIA